MKIKPNNFSILRGLGEALAKNNVGYAENKDIRLGTETRAGLLILAQRE